MSDCNIVIKETKRLTNSEDRIMKDITDVNYTSVSSFAPTGAESITIKAKTGVTDTAEYVASMLDLNPVYIESVEDYIRAVKRDSTNRGEDIDLYFWA